MSTVATIYGVMFDLIQEVWWLVAFLAGGYFVLLLINAMKRGSGV